MKNALHSPAAPGAVTRTVRRRAATQPPVLPPTDREGAWKGFGPLPTITLPALRAAKVPVSWRHPATAGVRVRHVRVSAPCRMHPWVTRILGSVTRATQYDVSKSTPSTSLITISPDLGRRRTNVSRTIVRIAPGAHCSILELAEDVRTDGTTSTLVSETVYLVGAGAEVSIVTHLGAAGGQLTLHHRTMRLGRGARASMDAVVAGSGRVHLTDTQLLVGEGAGGEIACAATIEGDGRFSHDVLQAAQERGCRIRLVGRTTVSDRGRAVFIGTVRLREHASASDAHQSHRALLLSDTAASDATPSLEILCADVRCSHAATTSRLDAAERFYLESRGINHDQAGILLTRAFLRPAYERAGAVVSGHPIKLPT